MSGYFYHLLFELYTPKDPPSRFSDLSHLTDKQVSHLPVWVPPSSTASIFTTRLPHHHSPLELRQTSSRHFRQKSKSKEKQFEPTRHPDYRFGRVFVESIDMAPPPPSADTLAPERKPTSTSTSIGVASGLTASKAQFIPLSTTTTEFGYGVVHLYRDVYETPDLYSSALKSDRKQLDNDNTPLDDEALTTLAVLAVPSYMTPSDFMGFVGDNTRDAVSHFRMVRTGKANRYMVLMKFRDKPRAAKFLKDFNGKAFNSMEPENCHVVYVKSITFATPTTPNPSSVFPTISNDPFSPTPSPTPDSGAPTTLTTKPAPPPTPSLLELPTCPVCLERMDETTGLLTILCQHVFHCSCLSKWRDSSCPVCRYTQNPGGSTSEPDINHNDALCSACDGTQNLWVCLICGNIGCGRYDSAHAFAHYKETSHAYAMDIESSRVWDYVSDGYVHRLVQDKSGGKLVELSTGHAPSEKEDDIGIEYAYLLTSQLESQRTYYEQKVAQAADKAAAAMAAAEKATASSSALAVEFRELKLSHEKLLTETIPELERDKKRAEAKAIKATELANRLQKEWREEKGVSEGLLEKCKFLMKEKEEAEIKVQELEEQARDLLAHFEASTKFKGVNEDVREGSLVVGEAPPPPKKKGKGKGRR